MEGFLEGTISEHNAYIIRVKRLKCGKDRFELSAVRALRFAVFHKSHRRVNWSQNPFILGNFRQPWKW